MNKTYYYAIPGETRALEGLLENYKDDFIRNEYLGKLERGFDETVNLLEECSDKGVILPEHDWWRERLEFLRETILNEIKKER